MHKIWTRRHGSLFVMTVLLLSAAGCPWLGRTSVAPAGSTNLNQYRASLPAFPKKNGHTRSRLAKGCYNCWTDVTITASDTARYFGPGHPPAAGDSVAVIFIRNIGDKETVMYNLKPSSVADYVVYVVNQSGQVKWVLVEVPAGPFGTLAVRMHGGIYGCSHTPSPTSVADFRDCDYSATLKGELRLASMSGFEKFLSGFKKSAAAMIGEDPGWVGCTDGCCTLMLD